MQTQHKGHVVDMKQVADLKNSRSQERTRIRKLVAERPHYRSKWKLAIMTALEANGVVCVPHERIAEYIDRHFPGVPLPEYLGTSLHDLLHGRYRFSENFEYKCFVRDVDKVKKDLLRFYKPIALALEGQAPQSPRAD